MLPLLALSTQLTKENFEKWTEGKSVFIKSAEQRAEQLAEQRAEQLAED